MLESFRRHQRYTVAVLGVIAMLSFVVLPMVQQYVESRNMGGGTQEEKAIRFAGKELSQATIDRKQYIHGRTLAMLQQVANVVFSRQGQPKVPGFLLDREGNILRPGISALNEPAHVIQSAVLAHEARQQGFEVSDDTVDQWLNAYTDNKVTGQELNTILKEVSEGQIGRNQLYTHLKEQLLADLMERMATVGLAGRGGLNPSGRSLIVPPAEAWKNFLKLNQSATITAYSMLVADSLDAVPEDFSDKEVAALYDEGKDRYTYTDSAEPGFRRRYAADIEYVVGSTDTFLKKAQAEQTEEMLRSEYVKRAAEGRYTINETPETKSTTDAETKSEEVKPEMKAEPEAKPAAETPKPESKKDEPKPEAEKKAEPKPEAKSDDAKPEMKKEPEPKPTSETPKPDPKKEEPKPETEKKAEPKPEAKSDDAKPEMKKEPEPKPTSETSKPDPKKEEPKPEAEKKAEPKPEAKSDDAKPEMKKEPEPKPTSETPKPDSKKDEPKPEAKKEELKPAEPKEEPKADSESPGTQEEDKPKEEAQSLLRSPIREQRFVALRAQETPDAKAEEAKPAEGEKAPAETATKPADAQPPAETKAAESKPADPAKSPETNSPPPADATDGKKVRPFEEVREELSRELAMPVAREMRQAALNKVAEKMNDYFFKDASYRSALKEGKKVEAPTPPDLKALAAENGLEYERTGMQDVVSIQNKSIARSMTGEMFSGDAFTRVAFTEEMPLYFRQQTNNFFTGESFVFWKVDSRADYIPKLDEVRSEVVQALRVQKAREITKDKAKKLVAEAAKSDLPLKELVEETRRNLVVEGVGPFTWMQSMRMGARPTISNIEKLDQVGDTFMEQVFTTAVGGWTYGENSPGTVVYVVKVESRSPDQDTLRTQFMQATDRVAAQPLADAEFQKLLQGWYSDLEDKLGISDDAL